MNPADDMVREILDQPSVVRRVLDEALPLLQKFVRDHGLKRLWLVGCGDMYLAAEAAAEVARPGGLSLCAARSMDLRWRDQQLTAGDGLVVASISGRTPRTLEALRRAQAAGVPTLAVVDDVHSPLAAESPNVLPLKTAEGCAFENPVYEGYSSEAPQTRT